MHYYQEMTLLPNPEVNIHFLWSKVFQQIHLGLVEMQNVDRHIPIGLSFPRYVLSERGGYMGNRFRLFAPDESALAQFDAVKWLTRLSDYVHCTGIRTVPEKLAGYATYKRVQPKTNPERLARRFAKRHGIGLNSALNGTVTLRGGGNKAELVPPPHEGRLGGNRVELTPPPIEGSLAGGLSASSEATDLTHPHPNPPPSGEGAVLLTPTALGGAAAGGYPTAFRYCDMPKHEVGLPYIRLKSLSGGQAFCLWIEKTPAGQPVGGGFSCYGLSATATVPEF
jgi:CRISPR-associated endonuclease Csy4